MNRKPLAFLVAVVAFVVGWYGSRAVINMFRGEKAIASDILTRHWSEQAIGPAGIVFDAPWPLETSKLDLPPDLARLVSTSTTSSHEADGLNVMASYMAFAPGTPTNLEGAADGAIANLRTVKGNTSVEGQKKEISILSGKRAFEIEAGVKRSDGRPLRLRGIVFGDAPELYQILVICRDDQPLGAQVWEKMRNSVRVR